MQKPLPKKMPNCSNRSSNSHFSYYITVNHWKIKQAANCIHSGGIVAYPTEAVYGLGCDPFNASAVTRLLGIKQRPLDLGLILVASSLDQLKPFIVLSDNKILKRITDTWPGPVTWVIPAPPSVPRFLTGNHDSIAVRVSSHPIVHTLCETVGHAIVSTSANVHHQPPARSALAVRRVFGENIDIILNGDVGPSQRPTEIRDALSNTVIRPA